MKMNSNKWIGIAGMLMIFVSVFIDWIHGTVLGSLVVLTGMITDMWRELKER